MARERADKSTACTGAPPEESKSVSRVKPIFGGRFIEYRMAGTMMIDVDGVPREFPVQGLGYTGYDVFKQKYVGVWIDSHGTGIWFTEGTVDETGKVFRSFTTADDWMTETRGKPYMMVDRIVDENTINSEMYDLTNAGRKPIWKAHWRRRLEQPEARQDKKKAEQSSSGR